MEGKIYRQKEGRRTFRFEWEGERYFAKVFMGVGWRTLLRALLKFRKPVISAENEWRAIEKLQQIGIATMEVVGYGKRGRNPARRQSFLITKELTSTVSLEDFCRDWKSQPPPPRFKRQLIKRVAQIAKQLHDHGMVHRDLYLCHLLLDNSGATSGVVDTLPQLHLIDLHRAEQHRRLGRRWRIKDVAGLYFSSMDIGLTRRDLLRFIETYSGRPWREAIQREARFWGQVARRARAGYREFRRKNPQLFG